ncbi:hypothetical protein CABS02_14193 [Colletotrichum abscissum]|uniref:Uncharacterized protein n=1 Tax=Colletotrichum abscissum TaxID=1671311 RepID=A0A9P9X1J0_9PEZI|nr:hypothetical protein CABS02_14193 [Colletotrichum abscissum]
MPASLTPKRINPMDQGWSRRVKPEFRDLGPLVDKRHTMFNTMPVSVLSSEEFIDVAIDVASQAGNRQDIEKLLADQHRKRCQSVKHTLNNIAHRSIYEKPPSPARMRDAALEVSQSCSLYSFIRFVQGAISGWKDDEWEEGHPHASSVSGFDGNEAENERTHDGTTDDGRDAFAYENSHPLELDTLPEWDSRNGNWQDEERVTECTDEGASESSGRLSPPAVEHDCASTKGAEAREVLTACADPPFEVPNQTKEIPLAGSTSPNTRSLLPRLTDNAPLDAGLPLDTDSPAPTKSPLPEAVQPMTPKRSPDHDDGNPVSPSDLHPDTTLPQSEVQQDSHVQHGVVATTPASRRKRSLPESLDADADDEQRPCWKRKRL